MTTTTTTTTNGFDKSMAPWKCLKCKITFTNKEEMTEHFIKTGWYESDTHMTYFHVILDKNNDDIMYGKKHFLTN